MPEVANLGRVGPGLQVPLFSMRASFGLPAPSCFLPLGSDVAVRWGSSM